MRVRHLLLAALSLGIVAFLATPAVAQTQTGTIDGVVIDPDGGALPGVLVTLESEALIVPQTSTTNNRGVYQFIALPPGEYELTYELQGFRTVERQEIRVNVASVTSVDVTMTLASVEETVTVSGASPVVDVRSNNESANFDTAMLENIPQAREIWSTVEQMPGSTMSKYNVGGAESAQQSSMQVHGSMTGQQEYAINGLKLNWPGGNGGATAFYFDHDSFAEINVMTNGAPAEVGTGGVYMNMVQKSGGNSLHGGGTFLWEDESFQGDNVSEALREQGVEKGNPLNHLYDMNANIGGPIVQDRTWFFGSWRFYNISTQVLGIQRPDGTPAPDLNHQSNAMAKVTHQLNPDHQLTGLFNWNFQNRFFRRPTGDLVEEVASWRQIEPATIAQGQWTGVMGDNLFVDARYGFLWLRFPLAYQPEVGPNDFARQDIIRRTLRGAATVDFENIATRHQVNVSASYFASDWAGSHTLKTGLSFGRASNQNTNRANGNWVLRFFDGEPFEVQTYNTPQTAENLYDQWALFAQDTWTPTDKLTFNYGVRYERWEGFAPAQSQPGNEFFPQRDFAAIDGTPLWNNVVWRLGTTYDVTGDGRTAIKAFVGRYMGQEGTRLVEATNPNELSGDFRAWNDTNGNLVPDAGELGLPTRPFGGAVTRVDDDLEQPYSDEFILGVERELIPGLALEVTYFRRQNRRRFSGLNLAVPPSAYSAVTVNGPEGPITAFNQDPATLGLADFLIANIPDLEDDYDGVEFSVRKRMSNSWQLMAGLTIGRDEGVFDRGLGDDFNNPNLNINREDSTIGQDSTYVGKIVGTYIFPREILFSSNFRYFTGQPVTKVATLSGLNQGTVSILTQARGETRLDNVALWDVRVAKVFDVAGFGELEAMLDVFNLLNEEATTTINSNAGPFFGDPIAIMPPRVARIGVQFTF